MAGDGVTKDVVAVFNRKFLTHAPVDSDWPGEIAAWLTSEHEFDTHIEDDKL
jgi:hypothetical protein